MSFATTISALSSKVDGLIANRVAKFAYTQQAYNSDNVNGVTEYDYSAEQNIPTSTASVLKVNETILTKGWRTQASAITRMLMNHFLGRTSYNLNKTVDFLKSLMTAITDNMGVAEGFATLDANGRIPSSQLTEEVMEYKGEWDADTNTPELDEETGKKGDVYKVSVSGTQDLGEGEKYFRVDTYIIFNGTAYTVLSGEDVAKVNNIAPDSVGNVTLTGKDIATSSVDSMSLADKIKEVLKLSFAPMLGKLWTTPNESIKTTVLWHNGWYYGATSSSICKSKDGVTDWTPVSTIITSTISDIYFRPSTQHSDRIIITTSAGIFYTDDWFTTVAQAEIDSTSSYFVPSDNINNKMALVADGAIYFTSDAGEHWAVSNITANAYSDIVVDKDTETMIARIGASVTSTYLCRSANGGETWEDCSIASTGWTSPKYFAGENIYLSWGSSSGGILYSTDGLLTFRTVTNGINVQVNVVAWVNKRYFVAGTSSGLRYTLNGIDATWNTVPSTSGAYVNVASYNGVTLVCKTGTTGVTVQRLTYLTLTNSNLPTGSTYIIRGCLNGTWFVSQTSGGNYYSTDGINFYEVMGVNERFNTLPTLVHGLISVSTSDITTRLRVMSLDFLEKIGVINLG